MSIMFDSNVTCIESVMDASIEEMLEEANLDQEINDDFDDSDDILFIQDDQNDVDPDEDVELPPEVVNYLDTLESHRQLLQQQVEGCDELLLYLPHQSKGPSQAVILYDDFKALEQSAAEYGMTVDEFKQKVLNELDQEDFTEEDVNREFEEFVQLQKELDDIRSFVRLKKNDEIKAIMPMEDDAQDRGGDSGNSVETTLAICNGNIDNVAVVGCEANKCESNQAKAGSLVSCADLFSMRDHVVEQLRRTEKLHETLSQNLVRSIESGKREEEKIMLQMEERKKRLQHLHEKEAAANMERLEENERVEKEEQKVRNERITQELNVIQAEIDKLSEELAEDKRQYEISCKQRMEMLDSTRKLAATRIQKVYRGHRSRKQNTHKIQELKKWKELRKVEKYKLRVMEVDYEIKQRERLAMKEKERQEKEAAEAKIKKEEEEKQMEIERKKKEEKDKIIEELKNEKEKKKEAQRLAEEMRKKEEEELKRKEDFRRKEEEQLRKEEEINKKNNEKKMQEEEEIRKREEKQKIKEEEKRRKEEIKKMKEEEKKKKEEEKKRLKEEEKRKKEDENKKKEEEIRRKKEEEENFEVKQKTEIEIQDNKKLGDQINNKVNESSEIKPQSIVVQHVTKTILSETRPLSSSLNITHQLSQSVSVAMEHQSPRPRLQSPSSLLQSPRQLLQSLPDYPTAEHATCESLLMSTSAVVKSATPQELVAVVPKLPSSKFDSVEQRRLGWIKSCIPWSKVSSEPWKLKQTAQKNHKRPSQAKKLPPLSQSMVLDAAHASSLREVSSVKLTDLPACSLTTLGQCWSLRYLTVTWCGLMCLDGLSQCKHLLYINAENNKIEYMDLKDLGSVQVVKLAHNNISIIHGLEGCINLRWLDLSQNRITRISGLGSMRRIHTLNLSNNQIVSTQGLEEAVTLQHLDLSHNYLQHLTDVSKLCLLTDLNLSSNNLQEVPELRNQVLLQSLCLQENSIKSLEPLDKCWLPLMHTLDCSQNMLESVTGVSNLFLLSCLDVSLNQITDMENLVPGIAENKKLETLMLEGNPLVDVYREEYKQIVAGAMSYLKSIDHEPVHPLSSIQSTVKLEAEVDVKPSDNFIQMCLSQTRLHAGLRNELETQMRVLLVNSHVTGETLCSTYFTFCDTSFKMASEHRSAHEYGDMSIPNNLSSFTVSTMDEKTKFHSTLADLKLQQGTTEDSKHTDNISCGFTPQNKNVSESNLKFDIVQDKLANFETTLNKQNQFVADLSGKDLDIINSSLDSVTSKSRSSSLTRNQPSLKGSAGVQTNHITSGATESTDRQRQVKTDFNIKRSASKLSISHRDKIVSHVTEALSSLSDLSDDGHCEHDDTISATHQHNTSCSSFKVKDKLEKAIKENSGNVISSNQISEAAGNRSAQKTNLYGQYLSEKDKFEMVLQAQTSQSCNLAVNGSSRIIEDSQEHVLASQPTNPDGHVTLAGVKSNVVSKQLCNLGTDGRSEDLQKSANDVDGNLDLDSMGFDIDKYLDMEELDEFLGTGWRPEDVPQIPHSVRPVLGKINAKNGQDINLDRENIRGYDTSLYLPPHQPSQAWMFSPASSERKFISPQSTQGLEAASPLNVPSPLSVASASETVGGGSIRSRKEELSEEWGFKDSRTVEMMLARAKKMKYNSERRRRLHQLDPQQRLHLLKKMEEKYRIKTTRPPSTKVLPRKEYFQAREEEFQRQETDMQTEDHTRVHRMFEWLHTQVGDHILSSSRINPGVNPGYAGIDYRKDVSLGEIQSRKFSPLSDHQKSVPTREGQEIRRYSTGESHTGQAPLLPPIQVGSRPASQKNERMSFRDAPVIRSGGWGGGKKRGNRN